MVNTFLPVEDFKESAKTAKPQSRKDMIRHKMKDM
jgi:hypothetical protein